VISQKPLDPSESPMPAPHRPTGKPKDATEDQTEHEGKSDMPRDGSPQFTEILMASPQREYGKWRGRLAKILLPTIPRGPLLTLDT